MVTAAVLTAILGAAHSYLGERYILIRLFRRGNLPELFRNATFIQRTLRLAWHVMSVLAFGLAGVIFVLGSPTGADVRMIAVILAATFALCGLFALVISRARHLSWIVFFAIAGLICVGVL